MKRLSSLCKDLVSYIIVFCLLVSTSFAQNTNHKKSCSFTFAKVEHLTKTDWQKPGNVFSNSLKSTIINGVAWLTAVQAVKFAAFQAHGAEFLSTAFLVTVPLDVGLSILSHYIALGKIPLLKKFSEGKLLGPKYEFWSRVAANVTFSTAGIAGAWGIANYFGANIPIGFETISAAILLCMLVYPSLQITKPLLLDKFPNLSNKSDKEDISHFMKELFPKVQKAIQSRANWEEVDPIEANKLFIQMLDLVVSSNPWEKRLEKTKIVEDSPKLQKLIEEIEVEKRSNSGSGNLTALRQELSYTAALQAKKKFYPAKLTEKVFKFDSMNPDANINLLIKLGSIRKNKAAKIFGASILDQALAVGFAGGVLLYSTTHWAQTGELPIYLQK